MLIPFTSRTVRDLMYGVGLEVVFGRKPITAGKDAPQQPARFEGQDVVRFDVTLKPTAPHRTIELAPVVSSEVESPAPKAFMSLFQGEAGGVVVFDGFAATPITDARDAFRALRTLNVERCRVRLSRKDEHAVHLDDKEDFRANDVAALLPPGDKRWDEYNTSGQPVLDFVAALAVTAMLRNGPVGGLLRDNENERRHAGGDVDVLVDVGNNLVSVEHTIWNENVVRDEHVDAPQEVVALVESHPSLEFCLRDSQEQFLCREKGSGDQWVNAASQCSGDALADAQAVCADLEAVYECPHGQEVFLDCTFPADGGRLRMVESVDEIESVKTEWAVDAACEWRCTMLNGQQQFVRGGDGVTR